MLTKREAAIISAYTGFMIGDFGEMRKYAAEVMEDPGITTIAFLWMNLLIN